MKRLIDNGQQIDLASPHLADININTIARSLSRIPRWGGMTKTPYSVGQHSLIACQWAVSLAPQSERREWALAALLHDAAEAYLGDVPTPVKDVTTVGGMPFDALEGKWLTAIADRFNCSPLKLGQLPVWLREIDQALLCVEYEELMHPCASWSPEWPDVIAVSRDMQREFNDIRTETRPTAVEEAYKYVFHTLVGGAK